MPEEISFPKELSIIPDELRSPIKHQVLLHRIGVEQGIRRFYSLIIKRDLFGAVRLGAVGASFGSVWDPSEADLESVGTTRWANRPP
jgi:hypothetical protein